MQSEYLTFFFFLPLERTLVLEKYFYYWQLGKTASPSISLLTCVRQQLDIIQPIKQLLMLFLVHHSFCLFLPYWYFIVISCERLLSSSYIALTQILNI